MAVAGRACIAFSQLEFGNERIRLFVVGKLQLHAVRIVGSACEAIVLLELNVTRVVSASLCGFRHDRVLYVTPPVITPGRDIGPSQYGSATSPKAKRIPHRS